MEYCITTFCYGEKYAPISQKWFERITDKCKNMNCSILNDLNIYKLLAKSVFSNYLIFSSLIFLYLPETPLPYFFILLASIPA